MKRYVPILALIFLCSSLLFGQVKTHKQPTEWSLYLKTSGAPWTKQFEVELDQSGKLLVTEQNPDQPLENRTLKLNVKLSIKDAQEIFGEAFKAFREFRFAEKDPERLDGTNLTLKLKAYDRLQVMQFFNIGEAAEENAALGKVLSLINGHLPQEHQVY